MSARPFPPSPRRRALARRAGVTARSPLVVFAAAFAGAIAAVRATADAAATRLGDAIADACAGRARGESIVGSVAAIAGPIVAAAAIAAIAAHLAQTRALWLPRRDLPGAPSLARDASARAGHAAIAIARAAIVGGVALAWLWLVAPRLARLVDVSPGGLAGAAAAAIGSFAAAAAVIVVGLAAVDALVRRAEHARALAMTAAEKRDDDRLAGADPRWRRRARDAAATPALAGAVVVLVGDDVAVAIAWDPARRPVPARVAVGRGTRARQIIGRARQSAIAVRREDALAKALVDRDGPVPERHWPRLAEIVAPLR
jgi:flagellar biosynthesis protein FlhB